MLLVNTDVVVSLPAEDLRGEPRLVADTGPTWLVKPESGAPVQVLQKTEWTSVPPRQADPFGDIFSIFGGRR